MKTMKLMGRALVAAFVLLSAGVVWVNAATTGTNSLQQALLEMFCDACGQPTNASIRNLVASTVTLQDAQTLTGAKTFSAAPIFNVAPVFNATVTAAKGLPVILGKTGIPFVSVSSGTMSNNGALTVGTALPLTYANAYFFMPSGSVAAGVPATASWLLTQCTTTTACTVCNNVYTSGNPTIPTCTPFVTTGPGAYTGDTSERVAISIPIAAGSMGANGYLRGLSGTYTFTNNGNNKTAKVRIGGISGTTIYTRTLTTQVFATFDFLVANRGATNAQFLIAWDKVSSNVNGAQSTAAVDTTAATTIDYTLTKAVATDNLTFETPGSLELMADGT